MKYTITGDIYMSLERVISEQQSEIDELRLREKHNIEAWKLENAKVENLAMWAFSVLDVSDSPECHFELKKALMAMGFCCACESRPCECGDDNE